MGASLLFLLSFRVLGYFVLKNSDIWVVLNPRWNCCFLQMEELIAV